MYEIKLKIDRAKDTASETQRAPSTQKQSYEAEVEDYEIPTKTNILWSSAGHSFGNVGVAPQHGLPQFGDEGSVLTLRLLFFITDDWRFLLLSDINVVARASLR